MKLNLILIVILLIVAQFMWAQKLDSLNNLGVKNPGVKNPITFSGLLGLTNNGFSIVPTFSLNSPANLMLFQVKKNKFSFEPEFRFTNDFKRGGMLFWFKYRLIDTKRFSLRVGVHPAYNFALRDVIDDNGVATKITQARRFIANEIAPNFLIKPNWSIGVYYLNGNGLQKDGPQLTHFITLNTNISNIKIGGTFRFQFMPSIYYLYLDGKHGQYYTATGILSKKNFPITISSGFNKTIKTTIVGGKDFLWNVALNYNFNKKLVKAE